MSGKLIYICDCPVEAALLCKNNPDCRPSYCKLKRADEAAFFQTVGAKEWQKHHAPADAKVHVASGSAAGSGLKWTLGADARATAEDLKAISILLAAAAEKLERQS